MSIPKVIHYCWFGGNPLPKSAQKCIRSWKKFCPDYEIIEWNEKNFDVRCNAYCSEMYDRGKWAFLTDYVRLRVVFNYGGIYLDTDVELIKPLEDMLENSAYMGIENTDEVATGLGFGAEAGHPFIRENKEYYEKLNDFTELRACPHITTELLEKHGLLHNIQEIQHIAGMTIYPAEYFCPKDERTGLTKKTANTYSIHHFDASWFEEDWKKGQYKRWRAARIDYMIHTPNRILIEILGEGNYSKLKTLFRRGIK